jgi:hypothetical protein
LNYTSAVHIHRRSEFTEDSLDVSFFNLPFCPQTSPSILTLRDFVAASPVHSYGAYATFLFFTLDSFITRDYTSLLREITLHCYERLQIIITRDYKSLLLGLYFIVTRITLHCYERLHFIVSRITLHYYERLHFIVSRITLHYYERLHFIVTRDYTSLLLGLHFIITRDYFSILIIHPPSIFTVGRN